MIKKILFIGFAVTFAVSIRKARAQQELLSARIEQIAGNVIYLNIGSDQGLNQGDTLFTYHDKKYLGSLVVIGAASHLSSAKYIDRPFPLTRGQLLQIRKMISKPPTASSSATSEINADDTTRKKQVEKPGKFTVESHKVRPDLIGSVQFGSNIMLSNTKPAPVSNEIIKRSFITTYTGLQSQVRNLPGQFSLKLNMQWNYRYASQQVILPANAFRIFQFQLDKTFGQSPFHLSLGRFYNYYEPFSGFWDGMMLRIGNDSYGAGFISGFDPIRSNEGFSSSIPKSSFYTYFFYQNHGFYSESEISLNAVLPRLQGWNNHYYAGWHQQFRFKNINLMSNLEIDQNPVNKHYIFSQLNLRANINLTGFLTIYGIYDRRKPYNIWQIASPVSYLRTQWSGGLSFQLGNNTIGGNYTLNQSDVSRNSFTYTGYTYIPDMGILGLGLNLMADYWTDKTYSSLLIAPGLTKQLGRGQMTLTYRYYSSQYFSQKAQTQSLGLQYNVPLFKKWYFNTQIFEQYGQLLNSQQIFIGITRNF